MIVHDYECQDCGAISETFITGKIPEFGICPDCKGPTKRIVSMRNTAPVDAGWISTIREVVNKNSDAPHCKEFLRHPTRANMKAWMKGENLRPLEPGERGMPKEKTEKEKRERRKNISGQLLEKHRERNAVEITHRVGS